MLVIIPRAITVRVTKAMWTAKRTRLTGVYMNPEQLKALASLGGANTTKESKTIDYKISMPNKAGEIKSIGIVKVWKRFSESQQAQIVAKLAECGAIIEPLTGETATSDDEF